MALAPATQATLHYFRGVHEGVPGVIAETATREPPPARATARALCGSKIAKRTVTVWVSIPQPAGTRPSASLSFGIVLVSRFPSGYAVWFQVH
jgi:hypothetical protein